MYRIYVKENVILVRNADKNVKIPDYKLITEDEITAVMHDLTASSGREGYLVLTPEPSGVMERLTRRLRFIEAAGGAVINERGRLLFIFRHEKWDLPKGKLDPGESPHAGGIREVEEECNIRVGGITGEIEPTWHAYKLKGELVLKKTFWYTMSCADDRNMRPQLNEHITEVRWFSPDEFKEATSNTYPPIKDIVKKLKPGMIKRD